MNDIANDYTDEIFKEEEKTGEKRYTAVIPTGGKGGGMYPLTAGMPKVLLPLDKYPLIIHMLKYLNNSIFDKVIIIGNDWLPMIEEYVKAFGTHLDFKFKLYFEYMDEKQTSGNMVTKFLSEKIMQNPDLISDPFLLHYGDVLIKSKIDWERIIRKYNFEMESCRINAMLLVSSYFDYPVGLIKTKKKNFDRVDRFVQKPRELIFSEYHANCAISFISKDFIRRYIDENQFGKDIFDKCFNTALEKEECIVAYDIEDWYHFQHLGTWIDAQMKIYKHLKFY